MRRVLSTYLISNRRLTPALLDEIEQAGFQGVELFASRTHFDYRSPEQVRELAGWFSAHPLQVNSIHAPTDRDREPGRESGVPISICEPERLRRLDAVDEIKRALDVAENLPFHWLVQHVGGPREPMDDRRWDAAFNSLEHLIVFAKQRGVTIALENTPGEIATPANLRRFIEETRLHDLRLCFDTGHAHLEGGVGPGLDLMRELVVTTHVHDNRGEKDEHLLPYEGTIDWTATLKTLGRELPLALELKEQPGQTLTPGQAAAVFEKFEQALATKG